MFELFIGSQLIVIVFRITTKLAVTLIHAKLTPTILASTVVQFDYRLRIYSIRLDELWLIHIQFKYYNNELGLKNL